MLQALPFILEKFPGALILHVGPHELVGESGYAGRLAPLLVRWGRQYRHLGTLTDDELAAFYGLCDVHVLPSINNTETFGMVQVEAALCGTPSVASHLAGVRMVKDITGMGLTVPPCDPVALGQAICYVIENRGKFSHPATDLQATFSPDAVAEQYEALFKEMM